MKYRVQVNSPSHRIFDEYFVETHINQQTGRNVVKCDIDRATEMSVVQARDVLRFLTESGIRARIIDEAGNPHTSYDDTPNSAASLDVFNSHENLVVRETFEGKLIELPLVHNRVTRKYYFKFTTSADPADAPNISVAGSSPAEVFERFVGNAAWRQYVSRFQVEPLRPEPAAPVVPPDVPMITIPAGAAVVGYRPGNFR